MLPSPHPRGEIHRSGVADFQIVLVAGAVVTLHQNPAAIFSRLAGMRDEDWFADDAVLAGLDSLARFAVQVMPDQRGEREGIVGVGAFERVEVTRVLTSAATVEA